MTVMIPNHLSPDVKSNAEKCIFEWFKNAPYTDDWVVLHSLGIAQHPRFPHGEIDFLVLAPQLGIFALEVKGGRVERAQGKWSFIDRDGNITTKLRSPFDQAWEGIYSVLHMLENQQSTAFRNPLSLLFNIGVMFPDIEFNQTGIEANACQIFDRRNENNVREFIESLSRHAQEECRTKKLKFHLPTQQEVHAIADLLRGDFDIPIPLSIQIQYANEEIKHLTKEQSSCLSQLDENSRCCIRGAAGTGKTLLAIEAFKKSILSGERVALFCYNKNLANWLTAHVKTPPNCYVGSLHSFMLRVAKLNLPSSNRDFFFSTELPQVAAACFKSEHLPFDRVIVDEAQDIISQPYLKFLNSCLIGGLPAGKWMMFGDFSMQTIYDHQKKEMDFIDALQQWSSFTIFKLSKNCRNSLQICKAVRHVIGVDLNPAFPDSVLTSRVNFKNYNNRREQIQIISETISQLLSEGLSKSDIVILSPKKKTDSAVNELPYHKICDYTPFSNEIRFSTIQGFKGLESPSIILIDIEDYDDLKLIYVAMTRARLNLLVIETEKAHSDRIDLSIKWSNKNDRK